MTAPLSNDLRERVVAAVLSGESSRAVAAFQDRRLFGGEVVAALSCDLTLHGLKAELASRGIIVSHNTIWEFIRSEGLRFKKNAIRP